MKPGCWCVQSGYYVPDVNVVRENYRAVTPPLRDISSLGFNIWMECSHYNTYKLVREGEPVGELSSDLLKDSHGSCIVLNSP